MNDIAARNDKAGRFRDFFGLQLRFAEAVAQRTAMQLAEAVLRYTNFHRRFGLGDVAEGEPHRSWRGYARELSLLASHDARVAWTQAFYAQSPDERLSFPDHVFGCFYFHASKDNATVRLHFYNRDPLGPLSGARSQERRRELADMFACIRQWYPNVTQVEGRSWLYGTDAYRRLFPEEYVRTRKTIEDNARFQGMSRWGQFLDHHGNVKPALRETFLHNIARLDPNRLWEAFPLPTYRVVASIDVFYADHGIRD